MQSKEILKNLVQFNTYKDKENKRIMDYIQKILERKGFKLEYKTKCLIMSIKEKCNLGFLGHTDTVQGGSDWTYNPLELKEKDGKLYGLGTCDMKGGIAAILKAVLDTNWNKLNSGIKLFFTYDEEIGFEGIKEINKLNIEMPKNMIIGEPTNNEVMNGSKGLLEFQIDFQGKSAHSSNPENGINAIEQCMEFLEELKKFHNNLKIETDNKFDIPYTTMNIGKIEGGKSINIVPNSCTTYIDFRVINEEHRIKIYEIINNLQGKYKFEYKIINDITPFITKSEKSKTTNFITEASFIQSKNRYILGTGPINAHETNEYITIESLDKLVEQYKQIIDELCL